MWWWRFWTCKTFIGIKLHLLDHLPKNKEKRDIQVVNEKITVTIILLKSGNYSIWYRKVWREVQKHHKVWHISDLSIYRKYNEKFEKWFKEFHIKLATQNFAKKTLVWLGHMENVVVLKWNLQKTFMKVITYLSLEMSESFFRREFSDGNSPCSKQELTYDYNEFFCGRNDW